LLGIILGVTGRRRQLYGLFGR